MGQVGQVCTCIYAQVAPLGVSARHRNVQQSFNIFLLSRWKSHRCPLNLNTSSLETRRVKERGPEQQTESNASLMIHRTKQEFKHVCNNYLLGETNEGSRNVLNLKPSALPE